MSAQLPCFVGVRCNYFGVFRLDLKKIGRADPRVPKGASMHSVSTVEKGVPLCSKNLHAH